MFLAIDIGNTNILFGKFDNLDLVEQLRIETEVFDKDVSYEEKIYFLYY